VRFALAVLLCAAGGFYVYSAFGIRIPPIGDELGPRLFPLTIGGAFLFFSILYAASELRDLYTVNRAEAAAEVRSEARAWLTFLAMGLYCALFTITGYLVATFLFVFGFLTFLRFRAVIGNALAAVLMALAFFVLFGVWLGVPLPTIGW
jgi:putative tricarboxylic transport membrane protein